MVCSSPLRSLPSFPTRRSSDLVADLEQRGVGTRAVEHRPDHILIGLRRLAQRLEALRQAAEAEDRKSTRLNSSHLGISYAVFCLKKKKTKKHERRPRTHTQTRT